MTRTLILSEISNLKQDISIIIVNDASNEDKSKDTRSKNRLEDKQNVERKKKESQVQTISKFTNLKKKLKDSQKNQFS